MELTTPPVVGISWHPSYRIVSSRFPPVGLFDAVADAEDLDAVCELEGLTNPRLRQDVLGEINLVPHEHRIFGPGASPVMAAFTHTNPDGSRFSDGSYGVYYAARDRLTAIVETVFHRENFLRYTNEPKTVLEMRCYLSDVDTNFHDIRGGWPQAHARETYAASQSLARWLLAEGSNGIVYDSVRNPGGECLAAFYPDCLSPVRQGEHFFYYWNGQRITHAVVANETIDLGNDD